MQEEQINSKLHKGTTTVGIVCKDGVVLAADKRASMGYQIGDKNTDKIAVIADNMAVTMAGLASDGQLFSRLAKAEINLKKLKSHKTISVKEGAHLMSNILYQSIRRMSMVPSIVSFMLGGADTKGYHLFELGVDGYISTVPTFASVGSGSNLALGVLETLYNKDIATKEGVELAKKAINAAVQRDLPTGDGIDIYVIDEKGVKKVFHKKIEYSVYN